MTNVVAGAGRKPDRIPCGEHWRHEIQAPADLGMGPGRWELRRGRGRSHRHVDSLTTAARGHLEGPTRTICLRWLSCLLPQLIELIRHAHIVSLCICAFFFLCYLCMLVLLYSCIILPCSLFPLPLLPSSLFNVSRFLLPFPCSLFPVPYSMFPVPCSFEVCFPGGIPSPLP